MYESQIKEIDALITNAKRWRVGTLIAIIVTSLAGGIYAYVAVSSFFGGNVGTGIYWAVLTALMVLFTYLNLRSYDSFGDSINDLEATKEIYISLEESPF